MSFDSHFKSVMDRAEETDRLVRKQLVRQRRAAFVVGCGTLIWRTWLIAAGTASLYIAARVFDIIPAERIFP